MNLKQIENFAAGVQKFRKKNVYVWLLSYELRNLQNQELRRILRKLKKETLYDTYGHTLQVRYAEYFPCDKCFDKDPFYYHAIVFQEAKDQLKRMFYKYAQQYWNFWNLGDKKIFTEISEEVLSFFEVDMSIVYSQKSHYFFDSQSYGEWQDRCNNENVEKIKKLFKKLEKKVKNGN